MVLERGRVGQSWRGRWDSFCLVTPNWSMQLPGGPYDGDDPDGYLPRDEIVGYLEGYASANAGPVREGVEVDVDPRRRGGRLRARHLERRDRCPRGRARERGVPALLPATRRRGVPWRARRAGAKRLHERGGTPSRPGPGHRERPVRMPDRRGAARGGPRGLPGLRPRAVGPATGRWARHLLVDPRDRFHGDAALRAARPRRRPARIQPPRDRARRRPRPAPADASRDGRHAARPLRRRRGRTRAVLPGPRRHRGVGGPAAHAVDGPDQEDRRRARHRVRGSRTTAAVRSSRLRPRSTSRGSEP